MAVSFASAAFADICVVVCGICTITSKVSYNYDLLGRPTQDRVTTLASGVDGVIRRIETAYEVRGMVNRVSSLDSASVGLGSVVNEVRWTYNDFSQSIKTYQSHFGTVNTTTTPSVQQTYADGSANTIRPASLIYPNGRTLAYNYGTAGGIDDSVSRISNYFSGVYLAFYRYLGLGTVVQQDSTQASLQYTLVSPTNTIDPDTGDIYAGLDRFGRVKDCRWRNTATGDDLSRVQYGYNRASTRTWRANPTDLDQHYDWLYGYDGLQRVTSGQRGTLNGTQTGITDAQFGQCWTLDSTGNWQGFRQDDTGSGTWSQVQTRTANPVNEITSINASVGQLWANPEYDSNGNMTRIPRPGLTPPSWGNLTKEQWSTLTKEEWAGMEVAPTFRATYDAWNRLVTLTDGGTGQTVQQTKYDGRNYRIIRQTYTAGSLSETRHYYYTDGWQDVEERLGTSPDSAAPDRQFTWGLRYIDNLVCRDRSVVGTLDERLYDCQDANWNTTVIVNTTGAVKERFEYDPYGNTIFLSPTFQIRIDTLFHWEITYGGYHSDSVNHLFTIRNRIYASPIGRWLMRDPLGYSSGSSLYAYVADGPLNAIDPLGLADDSPPNFLPGSGAIPDAFSLTDFYSSIPIGSPPQLPQSNITLPFGTLAFTDLDSIDPQQFGLKYLSNVFHRIPDNPEGTFPKLTTFAQDCGLQLLTTAIDELKPQIQDLDLKLTPANAAILVGAGVGLGLLHANENVGFNFSSPKLPLPNEGKLPFGYQVEVKSFIGATIPAGSPFELPQINVKQIGIDLNILPPKSKVPCKLRMGVGEDPFPGAKEGQTWFLQIERR